MALPKHGGLKYAREISVHLGVYIDGCDITQRKFDSVSSG